MSNRGDQHPEETNIPAIDFHTPDIPIAAKVELESLKLMGKMAFDESDAGLRLAFQNHDQSKGSEGKGRL